MPVELLVKDLNVRMRRVGFFLADFFLVTGVYSRIQREICI